MNDLICQALRQQRLLELRYHGFSRIVEPHIYGRDRKGREVIRCYQLAGGSESGERAGWKLLRIDDVAVVHAAETEFPVRPEYRQNDPVIVDVFCRVAQLPAAPSAAAAMPASAG